MRARLLALLLISATAWANGYTDVGLNATLFQGVPLSTTMPTNGQCYVYNSSEDLWVPNSCGGGGGGAVTSVFGRTGSVVASVTDYSSFYPQLSNNLSDLPSASTARTNLGLGSAATASAGNLTSPTTGVTVTGGTGAVLGAASIAIQTATGSQPGLLAAADFATFSAKQSALTFTSPIVNSSGTVSLAASGVTAGSYANPNVTVDTYGRVTSIASQNSPGAFIVYVNKAGNDSTCTVGNPNTPCLTIAGAQAIITNASNVNRYTVSIGPGVYIEANLSFIPWVWFKGQNYSDTLLRSTGAPFALSSGWSNSGGARGGFEDLYFQNGLGFNFDLTAAGTVGTAKIDITNVFSNEQCDFKGRAGSSDTIMLNGFTSISGSVCNIQDMGGLNYISNSIFNGGLTLFAASHNQLITVNATFVQGPLTVESTSPYTETSSFLNSYASSLAVQGATSLPTFNSGSLPPLSSITLSSGGSYSLLSDAGSVAYTPAVSGNWPTVPTTVQGALDAVAAEVSSPVIPVQASGVTPACATGNKGRAALTSGYILCVCNGSSWVQPTNLNPACTF